MDCIKDLTGFQMFFLENEIFKVQITKSEDRLHQVTQQDYFVPLLYFILSLPKTFQ